MRCLDEEDIKELMWSDAYVNKYNPKHKQTVKNIEQGFQNLYPNDDRNSEPKQYYVWHSVGDEKTRSSHEERDGLVFSWENPPEGGHPGEDYNCRCWAEDYEPPLSRMHKSQQEDYAYLSFDGKELSFYKNGEKIKSWSAMSGQPEYQSDKYQDVPNKGPLPEGEWLVKQKNHQNFYRDQSKISQIKSNFGLGQWPGGYDSWGNDRIWLEPEEKTNTRSRKNFSIHGGTELGSGGCIDLVEQMDEFIEEFKKYGKDMVVKVKYPKNTQW